MTTTRVISLVVAGAALSYWLTREPTAAPPRPSATASAAAAPGSTSVRREVSRLRGELFQLRAHTVRASDARLERAPASPDERAAAKARWVERAYEVLDEHHAADPVDVAWAEKTQGEFYDFFAADVPGDVTLSDLDCRGEVCRLELACDGPAAIAEFTRSVMNKPPWKRTLQMLPGDDDQSGTVYVARQGHDLPEIEL